MKRLKSRTRVVRKGDTLYRYGSTLDVAPAVVDYADILAAVVVEDDPESSTPWEQCDGFEHRKIPARDVDHDAESRRGYTYCQGERASFVVELEDSGDDALFDYFRSKGCSKQVAREMLARDRQARLDQLVDWYANGWNWYYVVCDFEGYQSMGLGGVDSLEYAVGEVARQEADQVADAMVEHGYEITNRPAPPDRLWAGMTRDQYRDHLRQNLSIDCWL